MVNILLIEDNMDDAVATKRALKMRFEHDHHVYHTQTLCEALALLKCLDSIDVILLDLGLPDTCDPKDTFRKVEHFSKAIPVVILTGNEEHKLALSIVDRGAEDYIKKSSIAKHPDILCDAIDFAIHRHGYYKKLVADKEDMLDWVTGRYSVANSA